MRKFTLIFAVLCLMGMTVMAQDNQKSGKRGKMDATTMVTRMDEGMAKNISGLTDEQTEKIHALNTDYVAAMEKNRPQMTEGERPSQEDMESMRTQMDESRKAYKSSLKSILSDTQYAAYEKYEKTQHKRGGQGGPRGGQDDNGGQDNQGGQDGE